MIAKIQEFGKATVTLHFLHNDSVAGTDNANKTADDSLMLAQINGRIDEYMRNPVNQSNPQLLSCMQVT
jgi:hypothetical protein